MALFQQLTCVLPILDNLLKANVINKQEHDIIKQKTQIPLQARELIDTVLVKGNAAANIFKNCLKEIDSTLYKNLFGEFVEKIILEILRTGQTRWLSFVFSRVMLFICFLSSVDKNMKYIPTEDVSGKTKI